MSAITAMQENITNDNHIEDVNLLKQLIRNLRISGVKIVITSDMLYYEACPISHHHIGNFKRQAASINKFWANIDRIISMPNSHDTVKQVWFGLDIKYLIDNDFI